MGVQKIVATPEEAYGAIKTRLLSDLEPVWHLINHTAGYSPFWLLARELFPVAESIGDLIYKSKSSDNLVKVIDNDFSKIRDIYKGKGHLIALLYRHSLIHQDEPRSIYSGNISIAWNIQYMDGRYHLKTESKDSRSRSCIMCFDLRAFYEDIILLLDKYEENGPRRGIVKRYNSWTFMNKQDAKTKKIVKDFYDSEIKFIDN